MQIVDPIRSVFFVGGKSFNLPKLTENIKLIHWEQDDEKFSLPQSADVVFCFKHWCSHQQYYKSRDFAQKMDVPYILAGSKGRLIQEAARKGIKISQIFVLDKKKPERKAVEIMTEKREQNPKIIGKLKIFILTKAQENNFQYPLSKSNAEVLQGLVKTMLNIDLAVPQIIRTIRMSYLQNLKKPPEIQEQKPPVIHPTAKPAEDLVFTNSLGDVFSKLFQMHEKIITMTEERDMYVSENERLTKENAELKKKLETLTKLESLLKSL